MILICSLCGATNRLPSIPKAKIRCGKCKRDFTISELTKAVPEAKPAFELGVEEDLQPVSCNKCDWEGTVDDIDYDRPVCPGCGKVLEQQEEPDGL